MTVKRASVVVGLRNHVTQDQAAQMREQWERILPDLDVAFIAGAEFATTVDSDADLIIAATRLHDALYRKGGEMDDHLGPEVASAFSQLQQALRRRGWQA